MIFPCRHYFLSDNKYPYRHVVKLLGGHFGWILLFLNSGISGSVPRQGTGKAPFSGGERAVTGQGGTQHIASLAADNTAASCVIGLQRAVGTDGDPELPVFGTEATRKDTIDRMSNNYFNY